MGAVCPASGSVGRTGGLRGCPQPWPWEELASGGPWASWTIVSCFPHPWASRSGSGAGLAGCGCEALAGAGLALLPGLGWPAHLLFRAPGEVHPLLVHPLGLHPLDEAEEVLVRHSGATWQPVRRRAALVIDPAGLGRHGHTGRQPAPPRSGGSAPVPGPSGRRPRSRPEAGAAVSSSPARECRPGRLRCP